MEKKTGALHDLLKTSKTIEDYTSKAKYELVFKSLSEYVQMIINEKGLKKAEIISRSNLSKDYGYQIINGRKENPTRDKVIMLAIGMKLSIEETQQMLKLSGYSELYPRHLRDSVIELSINQGKDVVDTNIELDRLGMEILE